MSDIFVSYDDLDRARVRALVEALEARGWSVWWDRRISAGEAFSEVIERQLHSASCVIVAWTSTSVQSEWVRAEASEALKRGKLVPVLLDPVTPPMPFGQIHAADLVDWTGEGDAGFAKFIADLRERIGSTPAPPEPPGTVVTPVARRTALIGGATLLAAIALACLIATSRSGGEIDASEADRGAAEVSLAQAGESLSAALPRAAAAAAAGHWQAPVTYPDGATFEERFTFEVAGSELSGTASMRGYGNRRGILDGSVDGARLSFRITGQVQLDLFTVREVSYLYRGMVEGDSIRFSVVQQGSGDPPFTFISHRISAEQASRIATGGIRPRLSGMNTEGLYRPDHIRAVIAPAGEAMAACYEAAEYDPVSHEFVSYDLTLSAAGALERVEMRPRIESLERCMREIFAARQWGATDTGEGGTMQLSIDARLPWNP